MMNPTFNMTAQETENELKRRDAICNRLFRRLDELKAQGADRIKNGEYDAVLHELQQETKARIG